MKYFTNSSLAVLFTCGVLIAQANIQKQLHDAFILDQQGRFEEAAVAARSVTDSPQSSVVDRGRAFMILGLAYGQLGRLTDGERAFDQSLQILAQEPQYQNEYAAALDNYAGLYADVGRHDLAEPMWRRALHLHEELRDHASAMRSLTNLAGVAIAQQRKGDARRYLKAAAEHMKLAPDLIDDDFAILSETRAWLALTEGNASAGISGYEHALEISRRSHGEEHWITGWDHMLLGKAYAQGGKLDQADANMREGLAILEHALGRHNPRYVMAEIAYSQVLDRTGAHAEAAQLRTTAEQASKDLYTGQCVGCTINVAAFR